MKDDLISRRAALNALETCYDTEKITYTYGDEYIDEYIDYNRAVDMIVALPSAEPDLDEWCHECKEYDRERHCCPRFNKIIRRTVEEMKAEAQSRHERKSE